MASGSTDQGSADPAADGRIVVVDAAQVCFARFGVAKTTLDDIALEAGISRATVYRYFDGGRDEIILGVLLREAGELLGALQTRVQRETTLADVIVEGVMFTVDAVRENENLALLFASEVAGQTTVIAGASKVIFRVAADFLAPVVAAARLDGELRDGIENGDAAEFVLRTILSLLTVTGPEGRSEARTREYVRTYCAGVIIRG